MVAPKKPQDRASKKVTPTPDKPFVFTTKAGGKIRLAAPSKVLTVGFARKNRHKDLASQFFDIVEALADTASLDVLDGLSRDEFVEFQEAFYAHSGVELGE